jgi:alpha-tubulin suppressor-like RCC1 family protein
VSAVVAGERHSHLLTTDGAVWSLGSGEAHLQGVWDNVDQRRPIRMDGSAMPPDARVVAVATGSAASFAVTDAGAVFCWGYGVGSPVPVVQQALQGTFVQAVSVGSNDNVLLLTGAAQEIFRIGFDDAEDADAEAASSDADAEASGPRPVPCDLLRGRRITALALGSSHGLAVDQRGGLVAWGSNGDYQCGTGNTFELPLPVAVSCPVALVSVACSAAHSLALGADGSVWSWGNGMSGRCGVGRDGDVERPTRVEFPAAAPAASVSASAAASDPGPPSLGHDPMVLIAIGAYNSGAVSRRGEVWAWGAGDGGQIGLPGFAPQLRPVRVPVPAASAPGSAVAANSPPPRQAHIVSLSFGNKHAAAVCRDGAAFCWGSNEFGQLSLGSADPAGSVGADGSPLQRLPAAVRFLSSTPLSAVACGENCTFFVGRSAGLFACGAGETAQLGSRPGAAADGGPAEDQPLPLPVAAFAGVKIRCLTVGPLNCAAVTEPHGALWAWGWSLGEEPKEWTQTQGKDVRSDQRQRRDRDAHETRARVCAHG